MKKTRTNHLISQAAELYSFDATTIRLINSDKYSPNDIYSFKKNGAEYILRIATHNKNHVFETTAEMEWLDFLHKRNIPVSLPLPMNDGNLVASLKSGEKFHAVCAFEKAKGNHCDRDDPNTWNNAVITDWGYVLGSMHRETKDFRVSDEKYTRPIFDGGDIDGSDALEISWAKVPDIYEYAKNLVAKLLSLPKTRDTFGLIHNDLHQNNFFVKNNKVHAFDFDDSIYGYFALDIGVALHHALHNAVGNLQSDAERIIAQFMLGYKRANKLDAQSLKSILLFMHYRQLCNFAWNYLDVVSEDKVMEDEKYNILHGFSLRECRLSEDIFLM
jgi:Ser/Thr protein kinase RdoA (MazF antagonist)